MIKYFLHILIFLLSCGKSTPQPSDADLGGNSDPLIVVPTITTSEATGITTTTSSVKGKIEKNGGASVTERGICWALHSTPTVDEMKASPSAVSGSGEFEVTLAQLQGGTKYYARAYASNSAGRAYGNVVEFTTDSYDNAELSAATVVFYKLNSMEATATITTTGGAEILEVGICYAQTQNPSLENDIAVQAPSISNNKFTVDVAGLALGKSFFIRPYVKTAKGVFYGPQSNFSTYNKGKITVNFHNQANIPADVYSRLKAMADHGVRLLEEYTSIVKTVTIEYNPGVPTADASISGWMRWGSNASYQRTGTFLHEFSHTIGTGQSAMWTNTLIQNGVYTGASANLTLKRATGDPSAYLRGDAQHWWPYGINGAHEDTGLESDYIITTMVMEGFKRDGIPIN